MSIVNLWRVNRVGVYWGRHSSSFTITPPAPLPGPSGWGGGVGGWVDYDMVEDADCLAVRPFFHASPIGEAPPPPR